MTERNLVLLRGVLFRCTIRGGHSSLAIIVTSDSEEHDVRDTQELERMVLVIVRMGGPEWDTKLDKKIELEHANSQSSSQGGNGRGNEMMLLRSQIRRMCKLGNELEFRGQFDNCKLNEGTTNGTREPHHANTPSTDWHTWDKFVVDYYLPTSHPSPSNVRVCQVLKWSASRCQTTRAKYFVPPQNKSQTKKSINKSINNGDTIDSSGRVPTGETITTKEDSKQRSSRHHGGGIGKRKQGEIVADFLLWMLYNIYHDKDESSLVSETNSETQDGRPAHNLFDLQSTSGTLQNGETNLQHLQQQHKYLFEERWVPLHSSLTSPGNLSAVARNATIAKILKESKCMPTQGRYTNIDNDKNIIISNKFNNPYQSAGGIVDAAGGAGHVSLALALRGVHSTVIDPRSNVGKLPGRDRKALKKSKQEPFSIYRAWVGLRPNGVDSLFREGINGTHNGSDGHEYEKTTFTDMDGNSSAVPICSMCSEDNLLPDCIALVALHPDEATGTIVDIAVENKKPFLVIPCCVFSRLFPERIKPRCGGTGGNNDIVSTYFDLLDWLVAKHRDIRVTRLPFEGANIAVWATFE